METTCTCFQIMSTVLQLVSTAFIKLTLRLVLTNLFPFKTIHKKIHCTLLKHLSQFMLKS